MCAPWTWYLANDFQFFILSPIFLITIVHIKSLAWVGRTLLNIFLFIVNSQVILICASIGSWISTVYMIDHGATGVTDFDILYDKPWIRISPYLIGLGSGVLVYEFKSKYSTIKKSFRLWLIAAAGWVLAASLNLAVVYGVYQADVSLSNSLLFLILLLFSTGTIYINIHDYWVIGTFGRIVLQS